MDVLGIPEKLIASIQPPDASNRVMIWTSSNPAVATVSSSGLVTAHSAGTTTIIVTTNDGNKTAYCVVLEPLRALVLIVPIMRYVLNMR